VAHAAEARKSRDHLVMVCILCDAGDRYLSEHFWDEGRQEPAAAGVREDAVR
jgi:hypothetical protein